MAGVVGILKDRVGLPVTNVVTSLLTPLDTYMTVREHTVSYPPMKNYLWKVDLPTINSSGFQASWDSNKSLFGNISDNLSSSFAAATTAGINQAKALIGAGDASFPPDFSPKVIQASIPMPGFDVTDATYQGWKYKFPTTETLGEMSCSIWADEHGYALGYYMLWHNRIKNRDGTINYPASYEEDIPIGLYRSDGSLAAQLTAYGAFPSAFQEINLSDGTGSQIFKAFKLTFKVREIGLNKMNDTRSVLQAVGTTVASKLQSKIL